PDYQPRGVRALALFVSHPMEHDGLQEPSDTAVLLLSKEDLAKGVPSCPKGLEVCLQAGVLSVHRVESNVDDKELLNHSFAGGAPVFLQEDVLEESFLADPDGDGDGDGDDDGDDGGDNVTSADDAHGKKPRTFVLQFGEDLIADFNFGDAGQIYVFAE